MNRNVPARSFAIILFLAFCIPPMPAQNPGEPKPDPADRKWKPEDIVMAESAGDFRISPDGKWVVWVKATADKEKDARVHNLFLTSLTVKKEIQLTRCAASHSAPRWSPNGETIAFLSTRPLPKPNPDLSDTQLWLIQAFGGEPYHLTEFARAIRAFEWIDDDTIIFSAEEDPSLWEQERKKKKDSTRVVDDLERTPPVRLFKMTVRDKKFTRLTENDDWIETWAVSRDGKKAVTVHAQYLSYSWDQRIPPKTYLYDLESGERTQPVTDERIRPFLARWTRDHSGFYLVTPHTTHPRFFEATINLVYFYDIAAARLIPVDLGAANGLGPGLEVTADGFLAPLADGVRFRPARYVRSGSTWSRRDLEGDHVRNLFDFTVSEDGKILVYAHSTASRPEQYYRAALEGSRLAAPVQITELNLQFKHKSIAKTEIVRWKGALDEEVEGILYYPHNYEEGKKYPLFTAPHGGPAGADLDSWDESYAYPQQLVCQSGAFVFKPNYHGSSNYGLRWVESICCGQYYELEVPDIEKGVDTLIARGLVDPERIGTFGWSNGSILSVALTIANPDRYKVISAGAGDVEWISDWANVDFGHAFDSYYFGKSPLEDPELYLRKSPLFQLHKVKAPTLIFFGTEDRNVPTSQGWTHYRALYVLDKVPVRFLLFPGEPHGIRKLTHQVRKLEEEMAWYDRYLFKSGNTVNDAFREDSPLGTAIKRQSISRVGPRYGAAWKAGPPARGKSAPEVLIPEAVKRGDLEIGRFEVTRAQYAAFDPYYKVEAGTENYPATGITLEKAKAYAEWLSKQTSRAWRIPLETEVASLYKERGGENTLDYWAGYAVNPDDAERLEAKLRELKGYAPLLKEVGSFKGAGKEEEELIFDLGGNAAEWAIAADGSGKLLGGSADRPADAKARARPAAPEYIGFRVACNPKKE